MAFVAEADGDKPAADFGTFTEQLTVAAERVTELDLAGAYEVETAATLLADSFGAAPEQRPVLLSRARDLLRDGSDALEEYRLMV